MSIVKQIEVVDYIGGHIDYGISFDLSKNSTGFSVFRDGKLKSYAIQFEIKDTDSPYATGLRMVELQKAIAEVADLDREFDIVCVEEAILGVNAKISSVAYGLNFFIDYMIASGYLKTKNFMRINNSTWKGFLKKVTNTPTSKKGADRDKKDVIKAFQSLMYPLAFKVNDFKSWTAYKDSGYQDMLDSVGVLFASVHFTFDSNKNISKKVTIKEKVFGTLEEATKFAKHPIKEVAISEKELNAWSKNIKTITSESTSYLIKLDSLGSYGVKKGYLDYYETYYIVFNATV